MLLLVAGFVFALGAVGVDMTRFTILASAFGVGLGFGLQNIFNNFVSGLILLVERPVNVGDVVEVEGQTGDLRRIGLRASVVRTADGRRQPCGPRRRAREVTAEYRPTVVETVDRR